MKILLCFIYISIFINFSIASSLDVKKENMKWLESMIGPDFTADRFGNTVRDSNYFYTWTKAKRKVYMDKTPAKVDAKFINEYCDSYKDADIIALVTPLKFRIIPYSNTTTHRKELEYLAEIKSCYKGPCNKKTIHYRITHDGGDTFGFPDSTPIIVFLAKYDGDKVYYQADPWARLVATKKMQNIIKNIYKKKKSSNRSRGK